MLKYMADWTLLPLHAVGIGSHGARIIFDLSFERAGRPYETGGAFRIRKQVCCAPPSAVATWRTSASRRMPGGSVCFIL